MLFPINPGHFINSDHVVSIERHTIAGQPPHFSLRLSDGTIHRIEGNGRFTALSQAIADIADPLVTLTDETPDTTAPGTRSFWQRIKGYFNSP